MMVNKSSKDLSEEKNTKKNTDIKYGVTLMGGLCLLGAQCCAYAVVTFRKYFHEVLNFKRYNHSDGDNYLACTF